MARIRKYHALPGALAPGNQQANQLKATAMEQITQLKQQIRDIQQQSLRAMHDAVDTFFRQNAEAGSLQLAQHGNAILKSSDELIRDAGSGITETDYTEQSTYTEKPERPDFGAQAAAIADKGVEDAMRSAMESVERVVGGK